MIIKPKGPPKKLPLKAFGNSDKKKLLFGNDTSFVTYENEKATREDVKETALKLGNQIKSALKGQTAVMSVAIWVPSQQVWKAGKWKPVGDPVVLWQPSDSDSNEAPESSVPRFAIYVNKGKAAGGCKGASNDCLYSALVEIIGKDYLPWKCPGELKKFCKVPRAELIGSYHLPAIDKKLNKACRVKLNVMGDFVYPTKETPPRTCIQEANVKVTSSHYSAFKQGRRVYGVKKFEKEPLLFHWNADRSATIVYDGDKEWEMSNAEFKAERRNMKSKYIMVPAKSTLKDNKVPSLKKQYRTFMEETKELRKVTNGE